MSNEMFQARLKEDFAEEIHEYREERHMSKSEAIRALLRRGLENAEEDTDEESAREDRFQHLAKISERLSILAVIAATLGLVIPIAATLSIEAFGLTIGSFGLIAVYGISALLVIFGAVALVVSLAGLVVLEVQYGIIAGWIGRIIHSLTSSPETSPT